MNDLNWLSPSSTFNQQQDRVRNLLHDLKWLYAGESEQLGEENKMSSLTQCIGQSTGDSQSMDVCCDVKNGIGRAAAHGTIMKKSTINFSSHTVQEDAWHYNETCAQPASSCFILETRNGVSNINSSKTIVNSSPLMDHSLDTNSIGAVNSNSMTVNLRQNRKEKNPHLMELLNCDRVTTVENSPSCVMNSNSSRNSILMALLNSDPLVRYESSMNNTVQISDSNTYLTASHTAMVVPVETHSHITSTQQNRNITGLLAALNHGDMANNDNYVDNLTVVTNSDSYLNLNPSLNVVPDTNLCQTVNTKQNSNVTSLEALLSQGSRSSSHYNVNVRTVSLPVAVETDSNRHVNAFPAANTSCTQNRHLLALLNHGFSTGHSLSQSNMTLTPTSNVNGNHSQTTNIVPSSMSSPVVDTDQSRNSQLITLLNARCTSSFLKVPNSNPSINVNCSTNAMLTSILTRTASDDRSRMHPCQLTFSNYDPSDTKAVAMPDTSHSNCEASVAVQTPGLVLQHSTIDASFMHHHHLSSTKMEDVDQIGSLRIPMDEYSDMMNEDGRFVIKQEIKQEVDKCMLEAEGNSDDAEDQVKLDDVNEKLQNHGHEFHDIQDQMVKIEDADDNIGSAHEQVIIDIKSVVQLDEQMVDSFLCYGEKNQDNSGSNMDSPSKEMDPREIYNLEIQAESSECHVYKEIFDQNECSNVLCKTTFEDADCENSSKERNCKTVATCSIAQMNNSESSNEDCSESQEDGDKSVPNFQSSGAPVDNVEGVEETFQLGEGEGNDSAAHCEERVQTNSTSSTDGDSRTEKSIVKCEICDKVLANARYLERHYHEIHGGMKRFKCNVCGKVFAQNSYLQSHLRTHAGEKPFKCEICGAGFAWKTSIHHHMRCHKKRENTYKCDVCNKAFDQNFRLQEHLRSHSDEKPFKCDKCNKGFKLKSLLNCHLRRHNRDGPHKCPICMKPFFVKRFLNMHVASVHSSERPFKCQMCSYEFSCEEYLNNHMKIHSRSGERKFKCELCKKSFDMSSSLRLHLKTHTQDYRFRCHICGKGFHSSSSIRTHFGVHPSYVPLKCSYCDAICIDERNLKHHQRRRCKMFFSQRHENENCNT